MEKITPKSNDSCISTTGTPASNQYMDSVDNNLKYVNLNFVANSETSSQAKEAFLEYQKYQNSCQEQPQKHLPNKILPYSLPLNGVDKSKNEQQLIALREKSLLEMGYKPNEVDGWEHIVQPTKEDLYKLLKNMIDNSIKPSVQIRIGEVSFNCHMMVLQCYSDFFMECNNEILIQLPEEKITPAAFMMVYDWMLSSQPLVQREGILELFNAANFLRIKELINQCWLCLDDDVRFREDTAFLLYLEARIYGLESLEQLMLMRICKFFLTLVASKEFLTLTAKEICTLLNSNTIGVNSEIEIFMSVIRWLSHNWPEREGLMLDVVKSVRFSLMPPWFLVTLNKNTDCIEIDRIIENPEVKKMINDGITYTNIQLYYGENRQEFLHLLERFQLVAPMQRQWVYDKECKYHHRLECPNMQNVNYKSFLEYLEMIRTIGKDYWRSLEMDKGTEKSMHCFLCTDCRKSSDPNPTTMFTKMSRDQGIQCPSGWKCLKSKEIEKTNIFHNNVNGKHLGVRSPRGRPRYVPSSVQQTKNILNNGTTTETESDIKLNLNKVKKQRYQRDKTPYSDNNQQQAHQQQLQTDEIERHFIDSHSLKATFLNDVDNDEQINKQQELMLKPNLIKQQQQQEQEQKLRENKQQHNKTLPDSCTVVYKRSTGLRGDVSGDCIGKQQHQQMQQHITDNHDVEPIKFKVGLIIERPIGGGCNEDLKESRSKQRISNFVDDFPRISNQKIIVFGGIDPYCLHCQNVQQLHQHKTPQKEQMQQQYHPYNHKQQQELLHRKRVNSIDNIIMNTTTFPIPSRTHLMQTHACAHEFATNADSNKNLENIENFGDHVLYYDTDAMEWRHLSHIPFGSRHHHGVVVCNDLIYVIGGTRTALGCTKKSVFEKSIWCFNPVTVKWTLETNLPESRRDFAVVAIESTNKLCDKVIKHEMGFYVIGGEGVDGRVLSSVWFYNLKRKIWLKKPSLNMGRYGLAAAMVNNEIWVAGGIISYNNSHSETMNATTAHVITDTIEIYNLKCAHCDILANKRARGFLNSKFLDDGNDEEGEADGGILSTNIDNAKNVKNKQWNAADNNNCMENQWMVSKMHLRIPRLFAKFCKMSNGSMYLVGGISFNNQLKQLTSPTDIDVLNEIQQKWEHVGDLNLARHGHDVAILNEHCIVVIGGVSTFEQRTLSRVEAFCTKTHRSLKDLPDLPWPISGCAAVTIK